MPWKTSGPVDQRVQFIAAAQGDPAEPFSVLCARFGISRKTGYKWVARYNEGGPATLLDRPSRPRQMAHATAVALVARLLDARKAHPRWGPKKLRALLQAQDPTGPWPAASTVGDLLKRHGLIVPRRRRVRWTTPRADRPVPAGPNDTWCVDFKGDFALGDGTRCYPLTVTDLHSRYLFCVTCLHSTQGEPVRAEFERLFALYGLPARMRSDNGVPFATTAPGGLSPLAIGWVKRGITLERTDPGHPEQNGAHERMHRTLKDDATRPPEHDRAAQQVRFDRFRREYNELRPHESLGQTTPASHYAPSSRMGAGVLADPVYPAGWRALRVSKPGKIEVHGHPMHLHAMLVGERVGLEPLDEHRWAVFFGPVRLGLIDTSVPKPRLQPALRESRRLAPPTESPSSRTVATSVSDRETRDPDRVDPPSGS